MQGRADQNNIDAAQINDYWEEKSGALKNRVDEIKRDDDGEVLSSSLYAGIQDYQSEHEAKIANFEKQFEALNNKITTEDVAKETARDVLEETDGEEKTEKGEADRSTYFRRKFVAYLNQITLQDGNQCEKSIKKRQKNPESAAIKMEALLTEEGTALYKLALEEEMNSEAYMNAVLNASTKAYYTEEQWDKRPVIIVGGPSSSGKTFAADHVVKTLQSVPEDHDSEENKQNKVANYVISVDGAVAREVSQMRKLVIKVSNKKGYTGVKDLHRQSKVLEEVKSRVKDYVLRDECPHGAVIPETFSSFPFVGEKLIDGIVNLPNAKPVFSRVVGHEKKPNLPQKLFQKLLAFLRLRPATPNRFKNVVAFMGSRRAWKTDWTEEQKPNLDMNNAKYMAESKAYGSSGFMFGEIGSELASKYFSKKMGDADQGEYLVINELVLKEDGTGQEQLVHRLVGEEWEKNWKPFNIPLTDYKSKAGNKLPPTIVSLEEYKILTLEREITRRVNVVEEQYHEAKNAAMTVTDKDVNGVASKLGSLDLELSLLQGIQGALRSQLRGVTTIDECKSLLLPLLNLKGADREHISKSTQDLLEHSKVEIYGSTPLKKVITHGIKHNVRKVTRLTKEMAELKEKSFWSEYGSFIVGSTATGAAIGLAIGAALGFGTGVAAAVPTFGISLVATPFAMGILGGIGAIIGGAIGFGLGLAKCYSARKLEHQRLLFSPDSHGSDTSRIRDRLLRQRQQQATKRKSVNYSSGGEGDRFLSSPDEGESLSPEGSLRSSSGSSGSSESPRESDKEREGDFRRISMSMQA